MSENASKSGALVQNTKDLLLGCRKGISLNMPKTLVPEEHRGCPHRFSNLQMLVYRVIFDRKLVFWGISPISALNLRTNPYRTKSRTI